MKNYDYLIIGAGIMGLSIARKIRQSLPDATILTIDKEDEVAMHASSRNSGVLHAGFYYTVDSLKAKFTVEGNRAMKDFCRQHHLKLNECGKLVVAQNEEELTALYELKTRGERNGSNIKIIDEKEASALEPNVRTYKKALYSPDTASVDPNQVCRMLKTFLEQKGVHFSLKSAYLGHHGQTIRTTQGEFEGKVIINCAGLYADKIARDFGFSKNYTIIPFKGLYLKYNKNKTDVKMNIYPVPNLKNPFLGVHFTKTVEGDIKIGPTAIPAFWRENYQGWSRFKLNEFLSISALEASLFFTNKFGFKELAQEEMKKFNKDYFISLATKMVRSIDPAGFSEYTKPGIRAQLFDLREKKLVNDFVVEGDEKSVHILNAVSPAFTCSFPFATFVAQKHLRL